MKYPNVHHAHIVPRSYLEGFAVDGMIGMRLRGQSKSSSTISTRHAAVRKAYYRRTRPDGSPIDDIEWSLSEVEKKSMPLLRTIGEKWPLEREDRTLLAELFAFQLLRGPRWKEWHENATRRFIADYRQTPDGAALPEVEIERAQHQLGGDTSRLTRMMSLGIKVTAVLASMHWTRIDFARPWLATSDQPVVPWPINGGARQPQPISMDAGVLETLEVRVPVSPDRAILMTWVDERDRDRSLTLGIRDQAANLNAFTIAQADRAWFHLPDVSVPTAAGRLVPLSRQLFPGYGAPTASTSRRRTATWANVQPMIGKEPINRDINVVGIP